MNRTLFPLITLVTLLLSACGLNIVTGSGKIVDETRTVSGYTQIVFAAPGELTITQDGNEALSLSAEDNLLPYIRTTVENGVLRISVEPPMTALQPTQPIRYTLSVKTLEGLTLNGSGNIRAEKLDNDRFALNLNGSGNLGELATQKSLSANLNGSGSLKVETLSAADLTLTLTGSGDVDFADLQTSTLTTVINGSGTFTAAGKADSQTVQLNGSGSYHASELESSSAKVGVLGSGETQLWVTEKLNVSITGSGDVSYKGKASVTQTVTGSGDVRSLQ